MKGSSSRHHTVIDCWMVTEVTKSKIPRTSTQNLLTVPTRLLPYTNTYLPLPILKDYHNNCFVNDEHQKSDYLLARRTPGNKLLACITCVMEFRSYSSFDLYVSKNWLSRSTRSGHNPTACSPYDTPKLVNANLTLRWFGWRQKYPDSAPPESTHIVSSVFSLLKCKITVWKAFTTDTNQRSPASSAFKPYIRPICVWKCKTSTFLVSM